MWRAQDEVAMTDQLADGFFLSKTASMGAQNILAQCVPTDQPVLFSLSDGREKAGGGVGGGVGGRWACVLGAAH